MRRRHAGLAAATLLAGAHTQAAQIEQLDVQRVDERYLVTMQVSLESSAASSYAVFADYRKLPDINPAVLVAEPLAEDTSLLYTEVRACITMLCKTLHQVQRMQTEATSDGGGRISAEVLPERSDLRYGRAEWLFIPNGSGTRLQLRMALEPAFWVPPLVGPALIAHSLREEAQVTSAGIERLALQTHTP